MKQVASVECHNNSDMCTFYINQNAHNRNTICHCIIHLKCIHCPIHNPYRPCNNSTVAPDMHTWVQPAATTDTYTTYKKVLRPCVKEGNTWL